MDDIPYDDVEAVLSNRPGVGSAAEAHGLLAGMLCMNPEVALDQWWEVWLGSGEGPLSGMEILALLFELTRIRLESAEFNFYPLLPDEESPLDIRALALGEWCQGFLVGVGTHGKLLVGSDECKELLSDLMEISRLDPKASGEPDEMAYMELCEYVRIGVLCLRNEVLKPELSKLH